MTKNLKLVNEKVWTILSSKSARFLYSFFITIGLMFICRYALADDDPLAGTDKSLVATLGADGTGRKFIYLIECIVAIAAYIKTKNLLMFSGVVGIAIFMNILFKVAGITG